MSLKRKVSSNEREESRSQLKRYSLTPQSHGGGGVVAEEWKMRMQTLKEDTFSYVDHILKIFYYATSVFTLPAFRPY